MRSREPLSLLPGDASLHVDGGGRQEEEKLARRSRWSRSNFGEARLKTGIKRLIIGSKSSVAPCPPCEPFSLLPRGASWASGGARLDAFRLACRVFGLARVSTLLKRATPDRVGARP